MKVHVTTGADGPEAWTHQREILQTLFSAARKPIHTWVSSPEEADLIFLCNVVQPGKADARDHPVLHRFRNKTFVLSDQWQGPFNAAGIYANAPRKLAWKSRFRTGSYALHHPDFRNPFVEAYDPKQALPSNQRDIFASFLGRDCHAVRKVLFNTPTTRTDVLLEDTSSFDAFSHTQKDKRTAQERYFDICRRSRYLLCPRGAGPNSIRLFESLKMGIAPVIISDAWIRPIGPAWEKFSIFIAEKDAAKWLTILSKHEDEYLERGRLARVAYQEYFAPDVYFNYLVENACSIRDCRKLPEQVYVTVDTWVERWERGKFRIKGAYRALRQKSGSGMVPTPST